MGDLLLFPAPPAPDPNHTDVTSIDLHGCWSCGYILFDDETNLCADCDQRLNGEPSPTPPRGRPLCWYLKHFRPDGIALLAQGIIEHGVTQAEEQAAAWTTDHHLDPTARAAYIGDVRGRALIEYTDRCQRDIQLLGVQLGWAKGDVL